MLPDLALLGLMLSPLKRRVPSETLELTADAHFGVGLDGIGLEDSEEHRQGPALQQQQSSLLPCNTANSNLVLAGVSAGKRIIPEMKASQVLLAA